MRPILLLFALLSAPLALSGLQGCVTNPATGASTFTGGMTTSKEIRIGRENHPKLVKDFGGEFGSPALRRYVNSIGQLLAQTVERKDFKYTFTVLNSDIVNAFAMPGGYIYITRGLLALADNEAQLAGVLAHELGHITALHHAKRYGQGVLASVLLAGAGIFAGQVAPGSGGSIMQAGQLGTVAVLRSFSRDNEFEADDLGVRYMSRAGYAPRAMAGFLGKLRAQSKLSAQLRGDSPGSIDKFNYLATHPAPVERVNRARANAARVNVSSPITAQKIYFSKIDGILYGDDPKQGFVRGRAFVHSELRFRFDVPPGFRLFNSPNVVVAFGPDESRIIFDRAPKPSDGPVAFYLTNVWGKKLRLSRAEAININGLEAATATTQVRTNRGLNDLRLLAIRLDLQTIYRFVFLTSPKQTAKLAVGLRRTTHSFRRISVSEAKAFKPLRLKILRAGRGTSQAGLAQRMKFADFRLERFRVLNGLDPNQRLRTGQLVKIVVE